MRIFKIVVAISTLLQGLTITMAAQAAEAVSEPNAHQNIVMIVVDDLRPVLGVYGDQKAYTPNIDALANRGVTFTHAYANVPVCGASRASMLTGLRPTKDRFWDYKAKAEDDVPGAKSLPQVLREAGYYTMAIGKIFHHSSDLADVSWSQRPQSAGMSHATALNPESEQYKKPRANNPNVFKGPWYEFADVENEAYPDGRVKEKALDALEELSKNDQPFFLSVGFIRPHLPFYAPERYYDLHPEDKFTPFFHREKPLGAPESLKGSGEIRSYHFRDYEYNSDAFHVSSQRGYYASVSYIDALVGDITKQIQVLGLEKNTTLVFLSDHGFNLGEHNFWTKHNLLDTAMRIPVILAGPNIAENQKSNALIELVDIFPTVTEIASVTHAEDIAGESFVHVLENPELDHKQQIYARFKAGDAVVSHKGIFASYMTDTAARDEMFFDLVSDPHETQNVVDQSAYSTVTHTLRELLNNCIEKQKCETR